MIYEWSKGAVTRTEAQVVGEELERLRIKYNGALIPEHIVREAAQEQSPLHDEFEWDDSKAANRYRVEQARYMIRHIVAKPIVEDAPAKPMRAFVSVAKEGSNHFTSMAVAMSDQELREQLLRRAWREFQVWRNRYSEIEELAAIFEAADDNPPDIFG